jgi:hypothetical protein
MPRRRSSPLRSKLNRLLALSLATPFATAAACHGGSEASSSSPEGAPDASRDASPPGAAVDAGPDTACAPVAIDPGFFGEDGGCAKFVYLPCGVPPGFTNQAGCVPDIDLCVQVCPQKFFFVCTYPSPTCEEGGVPADASIYIDCATCLGNIGRRPAGFKAPPKRTDSTTVGAHFARAAYLERASVNAFLQLRARLASFGAPMSLRRAALRAARDERRHARVTARIARRFGGQVEPPARCQNVRLSFEELALENAVEGCVRETFGALLALHQGARAADERIARSIRRIAEDEVRHAELAWIIHGWAMPRLTPEARGRVRAAQTEALAAIRRGVAGAPASVTRVAGLPDPHVELRMVEAFALSVFGKGASSGQCPGNCPQRAASWRSRT